MITDIFSNHPKWAIIINTVLTAITSILTALTTTSCIN